jgi:hypothetical protein
MEPTGMVTEQTTLAWFPVAVFCQPLVHLAEQVLALYGPETAFLDYAYLQVEVTREQASLSMLEAEYKQLQLETVRPLYR